MSVASQRQEPVVLTLTEPLTRAVVGRLGSVVRGVSKQRPIIVDVTTTPAFDSDGIADLFALQGEIGVTRLVVVGMRQAAARLLDVPDLVNAGSAPPPPYAGNGRRLAPTPGLILIEAKPQRQVATLRSALAAAVGRHIGIVILDMAAVTHVPAEMSAVIEAASDAAARVGVEFVLANVTATAHEDITRAALGATTYVAVRD